MAAIVKSARGRVGAFDAAEAAVIYPGIAQGIKDSKSNMEIARALGVSNKTVARFRTRRSLPNFYGRPSTLAEAA
jgi:FixJ family two-component response regulator